MSNSNNLGFMRYARIEKILTSDKAILDQLSKPTEQVFKPNGASHMFAVEVIQVAELLHDKGVDPQHANRRDILKTAVGVLSGGKRRTAKAPVPHADPAPKLRKMRKARRRAEHAPEPALAPAVAVAPSPKQAQTGPVSNVLVGVMLPTHQCTSLHESQFLPSNALGLAADSKKVLMSVQLVLTLAFCMQAAAQGSDRIPGYEQRLEAINNLVKAYSELNVVEFLQNQDAHAKENQQKTDGSSAS